MTQNRPTPLLTAHLARGLLRVTMSHRAAELERQLCGPNPTDFLLVIERPESARPGHSPRDWWRSAIHPQPPFDVRRASAGSVETCHRSLLVKGNTRPTSIPTRCCFSP